MTMGIDVGDRYSHVCLLDDEGEVVERDRVRSPIQTESSSSASSSVAP
jgi:predicted NBD/HSP70 family sugar kinase